MVFIEASIFTRHVGDYLSDDEYAAFQVYLTERPDAGAVIQHSGGARKVRWAASGRGKSGGVRVIYYWLVSDDQILLLTIYGKGEKENLTAEELRLIRDRIKGMK